MKLKNIHYTNSRGINLLGDEKVRLAFAITNRVMAKAAQQRLGKCKGKTP